MNHTKDELKELWSLPLADKVALTKLRITEWYEHYNGKVYVSFSGGKDSSVLLHIAREICPEMGGVFVDTGLEFPEVKDHVKSFENITIIRPKKPFAQVIQDEGWVFPSKEVALDVHYARKGSPWAINKFNGLDRHGNKDAYKQSSMKWKWLIGSPYKISPFCCDIMKKKPAHQYTKQTGEFPILATMASESRLRYNAWIKTGCNAFDATYPSSKPMSFWTNQDVLEYIVYHHVKIPSVYGDVIKSKDGKYATTGEDRTGCVFCPIGCHLEKGDSRRFVRLSKTHPKLYDYCINKLGMKELLDEIQEHTGCEKLYV